MTSRAMYTRVQIGPWSLPYWLAVGAAAAVYFALAKLGLTLASLHQAASPVWPAAGFAVVVIRVFGLRLWPAIALGALVANASVVGLPTAVPISLGNTLEGIVGGLIINHVITRYSDGVLPVRTVGTGLAAALATLISATLGVATLFLSGGLTADLVVDVWCTWWAGDALGILVVTPALLAFRGVYHSGVDRRTAIAGGGLVAAAIAAVLALVWPDGDFSIAIFLAFPVVMAAGHWLGARAYGWATFLLAAGLIAETMIGVGPFRSGTLNDALLNMQMFIAVLAIATLMLVDLMQLDRRILAIVFLAGSVVAAGAFAMERRDTQLLDGKRFEGLVRDATERIHERMAIYTNAMRGGASLFAANPSVSRQVWHDFSASLAVEQRYPGILGLGFVVPVKPQDVDRFIAERQFDGKPDFAIRKVPNVFDPRLPGDELFIITYIEPNEGNGAAVGFDIASEETRRTAAIAARDTGQPTASGRIKLVQDPLGRAGFLFFVPVYNTIVAPETVPGRRAAFRGWVYAPIVSADFFNAALAGFGDQIAFSAYDGESIAPGDRLMVSQPAFVGASTLRLHETLELAGRKFTLEWAPGPSFAFDDSRDGELYSCGIMLLTILLAALIANLQSLRLRATRMADQMTEALQISTRRLELVIASNNDGIWELDVKSGAFWTSPRCAEMMGYSESELRSRESWRAAMVPEDRGLFAAQLSDMLTGLADRADVVHHFTHKQGHVVTIRSRGLAVKGADGSIERVTGTMTDITQLVQAEQRLRAAVGAMDSGFALFDPDDRLVICNDSFLDTTAEPGSSLVGKTFEEIVRGFAMGEVTAVDAAKDREAWMRWRMERHRAPTDDPIEMEWTDGRWMSIFEVRTEDGGTVLTRTDVTAIKRAEQRLITAIGVMDNGFALFDSDDRLVLHNKAFEGVVLQTFSDPRGHTFEELVRANAYGELPPVAALLNREDWIRKRLELHRDPPSVPFEQQLTDGRWLRVAERRTSDGGSVATWTDITELKRVEATLQDAIESINEGFALLDSDRRYVVVNQHFREMHPHAGKVAVRGALLDDVIRYSAEHGEYRGIETKEQIDELVRDRVHFYESGELYYGERQLPDGRWLLVSQHPTSTGGYVSIRSDITEQKNREAELRAAKDSLEKRSEELLRLTDELHRARRTADLANLSKSQFLANMAHELRTPLNAINGYSQMILSGLYGPLQPEKYTEFVNHIHKGGEHLLSLINDILDLSKVEAGKLELNIEVLSSSQVAYSVIETVRAIAGARGVELHASVAEDCPILHADTRAVRQILLNLLSNAVKFTPSAGSVTLEMTRNNGEGINISVVDTGIGMTPEQTVKALELYGQVQTDLTKKHAGTGLGLPLVKALAERHGGSLSLVSEKDRGTTATVFLPWFNGLPTELN